MAGPLAFTKNPHQTPRQPHHLGFFCAAFVLFAFVRIGRPLGLGEEPNPGDLMRPFPAGLMRMWSISTLVTSPRTTTPQ